MVPHRVRRDAHQLGHLLRRGARGEEQQRLQLTRSQSWRTLAGPLSLVDAAHREDTDDLAVGFDRDGARLETRARTVGADDRDLVLCVGGAHHLAGELQARSFQVLGGDHAGVELAPDVSDQRDRRGILPLDASLEVDQADGKLHRVKRLQDVRAERVDQRSGADRTSVV